MSNNFSLKHISSVIKKEIVKIPGIIKLFDIENKITLENSDVKTLSGINFSINEAKTKYFIDIYVSIIKNLNILSIALEAQTSIRSIIFKQIIIDKPFCVNIYVL